MRRRLLSLPVSVSAAATAAAAVGNRLARTSLRCGVQHTKLVAMSNSSSSAFSPAGDASSSASAESMLEHVLSQVRDGGLLCGKVDRRSKVIDFLHPAELEEAMGMGPTATIGASPATREELEELCGKTARYSMRTTHPNFYNQLYRGVDGFGLAAAWLTEALNTNSHAFEVAPVFIVAENAVLRYVMNKFGLDPDRGDGIFAPGGSMANMYGMALARHRAFPEAKTKGFCLLDVKPAVFTSEESHYSVAKGSVWMGMGLDAVVKVRTDQWGRMTGEALEEAVTNAKAEGKHPFFVNATAGSTVIGAYDDFESLAEVCKRHGLWFHIDACWGGGAIMSKKYRHLLRGSHLADSVAWNLHKMLCVPLQCSAFVTAHRGLLQETNGASATYLFQQDKFYNVSYDTGDKSLQCGRKADGFKAWFTLKARGEDYLERIVDNCFAQAEYLHQLIVETEGFRPAFPNYGFDGGAHCTNVCFEYIPPSLRGQEENDEWKKKVGKVAPKIKEAMVKRGTMMIGYQPLAHKDKLNFFRLVIASQPPPTREDMEFVVQEIERCGKDL